MKQRTSASPPLGLPLLGLIATCLMSLSAPPLRAADGVMLSTELLASGFQGTVAATAPWGDPDRVFVVEQAGRIRIIEFGTVLPTPFLDITSQVLLGGEEGLLGLAFHPSYGTNGRFFIYYNTLSGDAMLTEWAVDPTDPNRALAGSEQVLLTIPKPFAQHNAGGLAFSPLDGMLWIAVGDGGGAGDPLNNAQNISTVLGSLLRIDVDAAPPYGIPADNPYVGVPGAREEIYAYGLRNPWRFSIDRIFGNAWIGDVGQESKEEVNAILAGQGGRNFGWRCLEGSDCTGAAGCECPMLGVVAPAMEYDHNQGCAIIGGHVYRGTDIPGLQGHYFYGDFCTGKVWSAETQGELLGPSIDRTAELSPPAGSLGFVTSFGEDGRGELLLVSYLGEVRRVISAAPDADCDEDGVSDVDELLAGTEFDLNGNSVPDSCELLLTATNMVYGQPAQLDFIGASAGQPLIWFVSLRGIGDGGPCFFEGTLCLDLQPFKLTPKSEPQVLLLGITTADAMGLASLSFVMPSGGLETSVLAFQALAFAGPASQKSNPIQKVIQQR